MFELAFAWAVFTFVLGKSAEAVMHAWRGTAPPGHQERMARIRAREAAAHRRGTKPSEGFRGWARTVWTDAWNAAAERHRERWPDKAAKKMDRARARWAWWDHVEAEAGRRWQERRAARTADPKDGADPTPGSGETEAPRSGEPDEEGEHTPTAEEKVREAQEEALRAREEAEDLRREARVREALFRAAQARDSDGEQTREARERTRRAEEWARAAEEAHRRAFERARAAEEEAQRAKETATSGDEPEDIVDAEVVEDPASNTAEEGDVQDAEVVEPRVLEAAPPSGPDTQTIPVTGFNSEENMMSNDSNGTEVIGLDGALAFAQGVVGASTTNVATTEQVATAMERGDVGESVVGRTRQLMEAMDAVKSIAEALQGDLERMKGVQEQYDANPDSGDKEFVHSNAGR